ncbi:FtsK/SpoIIIE domain-containing protein [Catellatospora sp. KI3]|uniref:FtsK/SpoIIIE domain-containing protein n=1 Tax=Catellatospora sp. KI3 TaxID=3041620 RepID=UPI00248281AE|nr:FtsK/SpoIIIE domain-containing protein [Catellatospora sp. KI3]MDI1460640.1 FtsK/SpoIIIE domain-containing protein [Catellatospora sp. KI3]
MWIPLTVAVGGDSRDLHMQATPESRVSDLEDAVARHVGLRGAVRLATARGMLDSSSDLIAAGIRPGVVVQVVGEDAPTGRPRATARRQLRVTGGIDAGSIIPLPQEGTLSIGRGPECDIRLSGTAVSRRHAELLCGPSGVRLSDVGSANGTAVDGQKIVGPVDLAPGLRVQIGDHRLVLHDAALNSHPAARLVDLRDGTLRLDRQPRFPEPAVTTVLSAPKPFDGSARTPMAIGAMAVTGLLGGFAAYLVYDNAAFLLLSGISIAGGALGGLYTRVKHGRGLRRAQRDHAAAVVAHQAEVLTTAQQERSRRLREASDPAEVVSVAATPAAPLWQRQLADPDFLRVRIGLADLPSDLTIHQPDGSRVHHPLSDVPLTVDLAAVGTVGITGSRAAARALARWLVTQAVVQSGPSDLRVAVLSRPGDPDAAAGWDWTRWLPHLRVGSAALADVGADEASLTVLVDRIADLVAQRAMSGARPGGSTDPRPHRPQWLVVVDDLSSHDSVKLSEIVSKGPDLGVAVIAVGQLPSRCPVEVSFADDALAIVRRAGQAELHGVLVDQISPAVATRVARDLAPLHDPQLATGASGLPTRVSLIDQLTPAALEPAALERNWQRTPRQTRVVVGQTAAGPLHVDLLSNGPHALVAGATGSGKSAMLQTIVASLAIANRPDELGFILVDFKGGAAFAPFDGLPHILGSISNLDGHAVMRALDSLRGDLQRRQRYLAAAGAASLTRYHELADRGDLPAGSPTRLPRMFVVIDEFAMLKEGVASEVLDGLVNIATVGRSLGVHLVIGTQAPRGVIPPQMRPNVNLKVAFRLDADHSQDVIGVGDAQHLAGSGRGYLRRGDDGDLVPFQAAFVGGATRRRPGAGVSLLEVPFVRLGHPPSEVGTASVADIEVIVRAVQEAAKSGGVRPVPPPWLPDLPTLVPLAQLPDTSEPTDDLILCYGQEDQPELRAQPAASWNISTGTHLLAAGRPRSGRSTLLRTLAASAARYGTHRISLYVMDCGGTLGDLASLPHCGAVVTQHEIERGARLLDQLDRLVTDQGRSPAGTPVGRRVLLLIDDWETWAQTYGEVDNGALLGRLVNLFRRGPAAGVHIAVTGGSSLLTSTQTRAFAESAQDRLALPFEPDDYRWLGMPATAIPSEAGPGRAVYLNAPYRAVQVAVVGVDAHPAAQAASLRALAATATAVPGHTPWRVDPLPHSISVAEARRLPRTTAASERWLPLGVGGDHLALLGVDIEAEGPAVYVTGERRSGRSNALLAMGIDLVERGIPVVAITPNRASPLRALKDVAVVLSPQPPTRRMIQLALAAVEPPYVVLVDDAEQLARTEAEAPLREVLVHGQEPWSAIVVAAAIDDLAHPAPGTLLGEVGRSGAGMVLAPRTARPQLFGSILRIPPAYVGSTAPGRAVVVSRSGTAPVQVPLADAADVTGLRRIAPGLGQLLEQANAIAGEAPATVERLRDIIGQVRASTVS